MGGTSRGCYMLVVDVGCGVGLGWNIGLLVGLVLM